MVEHSNTVHVCRRLFNIEENENVSTNPGSCSAVQRQVNKLCYHSLNTLLHATVYYGQWTMYYRWTIVALFGKLMCMSL